MAVTDYSGINIIPLEVRSVVILIGATLSTALCIYVISSFLRSKKGKKLYPEDKFFLGMSFLTIAIAVYPVIIIRFVKWLPLMHLTSFALFVPDLLNLLFAMGWLIFLDYSVYRNRSRIRRNLQIAALPLTFMLVLEITMLVMIEMASKEKISVNMHGVYFSAWITAPYDALEIIMTVACIISAYRLVSAYHKRRMEPIFLRFDFFIVPWIIGTFLMLFLYLSVMGFFDSLVLFFIYRVLMEREKYLDRETGAYNEQFLILYDDFMDKAEFAGMTAFVVKVHTQKEALLDIIKGSMPERAFVVRLDNGSFLIFCEALSRMTLEMFERSMQDAGLNHNPPVSVKVRNFTRKAQESASDFTKRILEEGNK